MLTPWYLQFDSEKSLKICWLVFCMYFFWLTQLMHTLGENEEILGENEENFFMLSAIQFLIFFKMNVSSPCY